MDSHEALIQILERLDDLKIQSLEYVQRYLKGEKEPQQSITRLDKSFTSIKNVLERKSETFQAERQRLAQGQQIFPGFGSRARGIQAIEGIGREFAQRLKIAGITTTQTLLVNGATPKGRQELAEKTGIHRSLILQWINIADLFRIRGIGEEYASLLEDSGVDTVPELAQRKPENLHAKLVEVNTEKKLVRQLPTVSQVSDWVQQAKELDRVIKY
jgi:predicted flap endonuclease-1-like 5' DNA nuclease